MGMWPDLVFWFFLAFGEVIMRRAGQPLHGEGRRPGTLRRPHRQALAAGSSQRHPDLAGGLRAGLPWCLPERCANHPLPQRAASLG